MNESSVTSRKRDPAAAPKQLRKTVRVFAERVARPPRRLTLGEKGVQMREQWRLRSIALNSWSADARGFTLQALQSSFVSFCWATRLSLTCSGNVRDFEPAIESHAR